MGDESASTVRRALDLLVVLGSDGATEHGWGVNRIADELGRDKSQVSRTLRVFADMGFVERDPDTMAYRIGWRVFGLAAQVADRRLIDVAAPLLRRLVLEIGERIHLSVLQGTEVLTLLTESPPHAVQTSAWAGRLVPAYNTSSGRALLIDVDREALTRLLGSVAFVSGGPRAPRDVADLYGRILAARRAGYALVDEEFEHGLVAASAPVRDFRGQVMAALNVSAPKFRLGARLQVAGQAVKVAADELSRQLGWDGSHAAGVAGSSL